MRLERHLKLPGAGVVLNKGYSTPSRRGIIFILSAPSGAGKTTISRRAVEEIGGLTASVSVTTRRPREGEVDGTDYSFVSEEEFDRRFRAGEFAEWARVFDARYGTPRRPLEDAVAGGRDMLLDIDIQGAALIRKGYPRDSVLIFVMPPGLKELEERLRGRGTEREDAIAHRLERAREEMHAYPKYDYIVVNADLDESIAWVRAVVEAERLRVTRLRGEFAPWKS
ncbi:MAG: guanylate kinase [Candidatus Binataceae bacterium]